MKIITAIALTLVAAACAGDPVTKEIDTKLCVEVKGKKVYTCCQDCLDKIKADPERFVKDIEEGGTKFDALENCRYFIERPKGATKWEFGGLKRISTPLDMLGKETAGDNTPKIAGENTRKVDGSNTRRIVTLETPKISGAESPKVSDGVHKPHTPAPGQ